MANTYTSFHYHLVFSTKNRERWITPDIEQRIWTYLGGIARENKMKAVQIGGVDDHVHVLVGAPASIAPSKIAQLLKGGSSVWVHQTFPNMKAFAWQDGYGGFSVSKSGLPDVISYIACQRQHHKEKTFKEEYLALLTRHEIEFDPKYLWD